LNIARIAAEWPVWRSAHLKRFAPWGMPCGIVMTGLAKATVYIAGMVRPGSARG
jgi:predicted naringenin-chalcone synthase